MKKTLLLLSLFVAGIIGMQAQCTITPGCSTAASGYCTTPAGGSSLPNATEQVAYSTVIQVSIGTSFSGATINNGTVTSVTGLPSGLSYSLNPSSGVINGGSNGCMLIAGTPATGSAGTYSVTANVTANTSFGPFPATIVWTLTVSAATTGINKLAGNNELSIYPNPASTSFQVSLPGSGEAVLSIKMFDMVGKEITPLLISQKGDKAIIEAGSLNDGLYFISVSGGGQSIIQKVVVQH
jgi:hypothetical protein